ncbi:MAG: TniB family NTP-binding protein [Candidatus Heimdallarchaeota archaeon]
MSKSTSKKIPDNSKATIIRKNVVEATQKILIADLETRRKYLWQDHWLPNPQAERFFEQILDVVCRYKNEDSMSIIGPSGIGKTKMLQAFSRLKSVEVRKKFDLIPTENPILHTEFTSAGNQRSLYIRLLRDLKDPRPEKGTTEEMLVRVERHFEEQNIRIVFLDDIHRLSEGGRSISVQNGLRNTLRELHNLGDELKIIPIGTEKARHVIEADSQTGRIFRCYRMVRWNQKTKESRNQFKRFLQDLESVLPLQMDSFLEKDPKIRSYILKKTGGITSEIVRLIKVATDQVMRTAKTASDEVITLEVLRNATYVPPSKPPKKATY